jgi:hypothetical protein
MEIEEDNPKQVEIQEDNPKQVEIQEDYNELVVEVEVHNVQEVVEVEENDAYQKQLEGIIRALGGESVEKTRRLEEKVSAERVRRHHPWTGGDLGGQK